MKKLHLLTGLAILLVALQGAMASDVEYRLLATSKTSTMQREMDEAAAAGYRFAQAMGGETSFGGNEVVVVMVRDPETPPGRFQYQLLATSKTSTMQRELQDAGDRGFAYRAQTVFETAFRGQEVVVILERDSRLENQVWEYKLLATRKTSTMQKELADAAKQGYMLVGLTVGETAFGGNELVCILRR